LATGDLSLLPDEGFSDTRHPRYKRNRVLDVRPAQLRGDIFAVDPNGTGLRGLLCR
jgi:hypothetical protein